MSFTLNPRVRGFMWLSGFVLIAILMSMPRKAMKELGFQACCLWCDAPDDAGAARCGPCINHHRNVRETIAASPPDDPLFQLAKEIMAFAAAPHRHDHDETHGTVLREQQRLAAGLQEPVPLPTSEEVGDLFAQQKSANKESLIQQIGNKNPWKDRAPSVEVARILGQEAWDSDALSVDVNYGARTVPSVPIQPVNREERSGEDTVLTDRVQAAAETSAMDDDVAEIFEEIEFKRRQSERNELKTALKDIKKLVDDDLEF